MAVARFTIGEVLSYSWGKFKQNAGFLIGLAVMSVVLYGIPYGFSLYFQESSGAIASLFSLLMVVVELFLGLAWIAAALQIIDDKTPTWSVLTSHTGYAFKFVVAYLVYSLITMVGFILLIVPGIIWGIQYQFFPYFLMDKNQGIMESLASSKAIVKGSTGKLFVYCLAMVGISLLAMIPLFLGLFVFLPVSVIASAYLYRKLSSTVISTTVTPVTA